MPGREYLLLKRCPLSANLVNTENFNDWTQKEDIKRCNYVISSVTPNPENEERIECKCSGFYKLKSVKANGKNDVPIYFSGKEEEVCIAAIRERDLSKFDDKTRCKIKDEIKQYLALILDKERTVEPEPEETVTQIP